MHHLDGAYKSYNFVHIRCALNARQWSQWDMKTCASILDGLNLLWDMANSIDEQRTLELFTEETAIHQLADVLTFANAERRSELDSLDKTSTAETYATCLDSIEKMVLSIH